MLQPRKEAGAIAGTTLTTAIRRRLSTFAAGIARPFTDSRRREFVTDMIIHHSGQGVQYAATNHVERLVGRGVAVSMAAVGKPEENGYAERLMRTIREEEIALTEYEDSADARRQLGRFLDAVYNRKRIHSSLGYLTPTEFEQQWRAEQTASPTVQ